jgi:hypothetical protein
MVTAPSLVLVGAVEMCLCLYMDDSLSFVPGPATAGVQQHVRDVRRRGAVGDAGYGGNADAAQ